MSIAIPTEFKALHRHGGQVIATARAIEASAALALINNATRVYAAESRRALLDWACIGHATLDTAIVRNPIVSSSGTYEVVFEVPAKLSADTDKLGFRARATHLLVKVEVWDAARTGVIVTMSGATGVATEADISATSATLGGVEDVLLVVSIARASATPTSGDLYSLRVLEEDLVVADLP